MVLIGKVCYFPPDVHGAFHHLLTVLSRWGKNTISPPSILRAGLPGLQRGLLDALKTRVEKRPHSLPSELIERECAWDEGGGSPMMSISSAANKVEIQRLCTQKGAGVGR